MESGYYAPGQEQVQPLTRGDVMKKQLAVFAVVVLAVAHDASSEGPSYQLVEGFFKLPAGRVVSWCCRAAVLA